MSLPPPRDTGITSSGPRPPRGFTLIEVLVALAIVAILSAIAFPVYRHYIDKAKITLAISTLETVRKIMEFYHIDNGSYPVTVNFATGTDDQGKSVIEGPLLDEMKRNIYSVDSYVGSASAYTLNARAQDGLHTALVLTPEHVVIQVPQP